MNLFNELKRRNVIRVGAAYVIVGWVIAQAGDLAADNLNFPDWFMPMLLVLLALGLPLALIFSWAFELTPEGLKKTEEVDADASIAVTTGKKLNYVIIAALVVALGYFIWESRFSEPETPSGPESAAIAADNSIAVLPFVNISNDPEQEYFSDGMTEEILNALAKIPQLQVAARTSAFQYKGQNVDLRQVGRELGVAHILEGSVRKADNTVRITAQLIEVDSGFHLWTDTFDRELENIFAVQEQISIAIADALSLTLNIAETPVVASRTDNPEAYDLYLRGLALYRARDDLLESVALLRRAIELDPDFALAWATLAQAMAVLNIYVDGYRDLPEAQLQEFRREMRNAAETAYRLAPDLPRALHAMGVTEPNESVREHRYLIRALQLDPTNSEVMEDLVGSYFAAGLSEQAVGLARRMVALDAIPVNVLAYAMALAANGEYEASTAQFTRAAVLDPGLGPTLWFGFEAFLLAGDLDGAEAHAAKFERTLPEAAAGFTNLLQTIRTHLAENGAYTAELVDAVEANRRQLLLMGLADDWDQVLSDGRELPLDGTTFNFAWVFNDPRFAKLRQSDQFHAKIAAQTTDALWREFGFPAHCRPVGEDDFECN